MTAWNMGVTRASDPESPQKKAQKKHNRPTITFDEKGRATRKGTELRRGIGKELVGGES